MAESVKSIYAQALFELCSESERCDEVFEELSAAAQIFDENEEFVSLLKSPLIETGEKHEVLEKTFGGRVSDLVFDFMCLVTDKGRAGYFADICGEFKQLYYKKKNILEVSVVTAMPLSDSLRDKLKDKLAQVTGKNIIMNESVDGSLIGGIIVRYENSEIDSSVRGRLDRLKEQIDSVIA